jgi:hypothetical protein
MAAGGKHIIQKQRLEVIANGTDNALTFQQDVEFLWKHKLGPQLEKLLDNYNTGGNIIQIDQLYIDVNADSLADIEREVIAEIDRQLKHKVVIQPDKSVTSIARREIELLAFYLQRGYLPWWSPVKSRTEWQKYLTELLSKRLLAEFTEAQFWQLVATIVKKDSEVLRDDISSFDKASDSSSIKNDLTIAYKHAVLRSIQPEIHANDIFAAIATHLAELVLRLPRPVVSAISRSVIGNMPLKQAIEKHAINLATDEGVFKDIKPETPGVIERMKAGDQEIERKEKLDAKDETGEPQEDIYIANSGLVIVAPYLTAFLKQMQLVDKDRLIAADKAVALLNYMVYGHDDLAEFECVLSKILCGLEVSSVVKSYRLSDAEKQEVDDLLTAVIAHWQVLKNTSVQGLRTSFLQREGRLSFADNEWRLKVQNEPYDVLLAHIPWNISMIKLSWMQHLLKVDWV